MLLLLQGWPVALFDPAWNRVGPLTFADMVASGALVEYRESRAVATTFQAGQWIRWVLASIRGNDVIFQSAQSYAGYVETIVVRYQNQAALEAGLSGAGLDQWKAKRVRSLRFHEQRLIASALKPAPSPFRNNVVMWELWLIQEKLGQYI